MSALLTLAICLAAPAIRADDESDRGQLTRSDFKFVCEAAEAGSMEVDLGRMAAEKASDPEVRAFGKRMVTDHQKAGGELRTLAGQKAAKVPMEHERKEDKMKEKLSGLTGSEFDKAYMKMMVKDHQKVVKDFEKQSTKADDAQLRSWVAKTLPTLQDHLRVAENLEGRLGGKSVTKNP
jgi:putative membrane protein